MSAKSRSSSAKTQSPGLPLFHPLSSPSAVVYGSRAHATRQQSISAVYDSSIGSQEQIVERAKQEASVMQRIAELRKDGLWSLRKLPKVQEPPREKAHWDYLLEEMTWLATDFAQERKWKKNTAKKCATMIMKYHRDKDNQKQREQREEQQRIRKVASFIAKEVRSFWSNVEKLVEFKQQSMLEKKRKQALDMHLNFIVGQTEQYTEWLTEGFRESKSNAPSAADTTSVGTSSLASDGDFDPDKVSEEDDEETIEREEKEDTSRMNPKDEIEMLNRESSLPLEEILPKEVLDVIPASSLPSTSSVGTSSVSRKRKREEVDDKDEEFKLRGDEEEEDDEETIAEQEAKEASGYDEELKDLEDEANLTREQLLEKYAAAFQSDYIEQEDEETGDEETADETMSQEDSQEDETEEEEEVSRDDEEEEEIGLESLMNIRGEETSASDHNVSLDFIN